MSKSIESWELSAFLDGDLPDQRLAEVGRQAASDPAVGDCLEAYARDHAALAAAGTEEIDNDALPADLQNLAEQLETLLADRSEDERHIKASQFHGFETVAARAGMATSFSRRLGATRLRLKSSGLVIAGIMVGLTAGSFAANLPPDLPPLLGELRAGGEYGEVSEAALAFVDEATEIHRVMAFAPEFSPRARDLDMGVVTKLFAISFSPPELGQLGFALDRIDVSATDSGPALVLLYRDAEDHVVTMVLAMSSTSLSAVGDGSLGMTLLTYNDLAVAVGRTSDIAYAVTSSLSERRVRQAADWLRSSLEATH